jgi:hypothetical protein
VSVDLFLAQMIMEESVKDALRAAEHGRLVRTANNSAGTQLFLVAAMQHLHDWWNGQDGHHQPTMDTIVKQVNEQITIPKD